MNTRCSEKENNVDVLLVNPPSSIIGRYKAEHLGMGYLAAVLQKENFRVKIIDAPLEDLSIRETVKKILKTKVSLIIGFSVITPEAFYSVIEIVSFLALVKVCLLYTSPSPRDLSTSRMPSSA